MASSIVLAPGSEGAGFIGNGVPAAVPEPASWLLMLGGLTGFGWRSGRRKTR